MNLHHNLEEKDLAIKERLNIYSREDPQGVISK
jgi:hypothetical protein